MVRALLFKALEQPSDAALSLSQTKRDQSNAAALRTVVHGAQAMRGDNYDGRLSGDYDGR
ncbi:MAG: hypothetical protein B7X90_10810 [Novosphingobium sp. 17-62-19]|nr:MAG: hypothetical protein B7X90_10810 [Novosphingobium sp. 17-62-19]